MEGKKSNKGSDNLDPLAKSYGDYLLGTENNKPEPSISKDRIAPPPSPKIPIKWDEKTLRDEIAITVMKKVLSHPKLLIESDEMIAKASYEMADAMLKERAKQHSPEPL